MIARLCSALFGTVLALTITSVAWAGQYTIHNCPASLQPNFEAGPWQVLGGGLPSAGGFQASCAPGNTLGTAVGWYSDELPLNSNFGIVLESPSSNVAIRELRLVWSVSHQTSGSDTFAEVVTDAGFQTISATPYAAGTNNPLLIRLASNTRTVNVYSYCSYDGSTNCYFPSAAYPAIKVEGMDTTLEDTGMPTASATSGALAGSGQLSGTATLQFTAEDSESGVKEAQLLIDGTPAVAHSYASVCTYTNFAACPQAERDSVTWNTSTVANGEHLVALRVIDASGNSQVLYSHAVQVQNSVSDSSPTSKTNSDIPPACLVEPGTQTSLVVHAKHNQIQTPYRHRGILAGRLLGPGGNPIPGATIELLGRSAVGGQPFVSLGHATTRARGQFKAVLPRGTSRSVCLRYGPTRDAHYLAALLVSQQVSAGLKLDIHPSVIGPNGTIILTGNLLGGYIPASGKIVELLVHYLGRWRVFETVRSEPSGRFKGFYTFLGGHGKFAFRARVRGGESGYPYALGLSRPATVLAG